MTNYIGISAHCLLRKWHSSKLPCGRRTDKGETHRAEAHHCIFAVIGNISLLYRRHKIFTFYSSIIYPAWYGFRLNKRLVKAYHRQLYFTRHIWRTMRLIYFIPDLLIRRRHYVYQHCLTYTHTTVLWNITIFAQRVMMPVSIHRQASCESAMSRLVDRAAHKWRPWLRAWR